MPSKTLRVPSGTKATLSLASAVKLGAQKVALRPKSPLALQLLFGIHPAKPVRLLDTLVFEQITNPKNLIEVRADRGGLVNGIDATKLYHLVRALEIKGGMPSSVLWTVKSRAWFTAAGHPLPKGRREDGMRLQEVRAISSQQIVLPDWIVKLNVYRFALLFLDIIVERNATLYIDHNIIGVRNFIIHQGARVVQRVPSLIMDITGRFVGDLA